MFYKKIIFASVAATAFVLSTTALADNINANNTQSFYIGLQGGYALADYGSAAKDLISGVEGSSSHEGGFGARIFAGWHFNQYLDAETGYNYIPANKYSINLYGSGDTFNIKQQTYAVDLVAKANFPLEIINSSLTNLSLYAKGGAAYVHARADISIDAMDMDSAKTSAIQPVYGAGIAYSANKNVVVDLSFTQIAGKKSADNLLSGTPLINFAALGITYRMA